MEMTANTILTIVITTAAFFGGFTSSGVAAGVIAAMVTFVATMLVIFLIHLARAPKYIYEQVQGELRQEKQTTLELRKDNETYYKQTIAVDEITRKQQDDIESLETQVRALQSELDNLKVYKLKFEIDAPSRSHIIVTSFYYETFNVMMRLYIRFENSDIHPLTVKRVSVLLIKKGEDETESEIPLIDSNLYEATYVEEGRLSKKEYKWDSRNLSVSGRDWTPYHTIEGHIDANGDCREMLDSNCFLRVTMEAMNQPPYSLDFNADWNRAEGSWVHIIPRT